MTVKAQIKAAIDTLNLTYVTARHGYTGRDTVLLRQRALAGGSKGPLTVTNAHLERCVTNQRAMLTTLKAELAKHVGENVKFFSRQCYLSGGIVGMENATFHIPLNSKTTRVITFAWQLHAANVSSNLDPAYQNYWYVMDVADVKTADIY
jgi:hypothetical protein